MIKRFLTWLRSYRSRRKLVRIPVEGVPESEKHNWYSGHRNVQAEDKQKMRGHLSR